MNKLLEIFFYSFLLGFFLAIFIFSLFYSQPINDFNLLEGTFNLINEDNESIGQVFSNINIRYSPNNKIGEFKILISTKTAYTELDKSIFSKDVFYEIGFLYKNKNIENIRSNYYGSINSQNIMYNVFIVPSLKYQLRDLSNKYGIINLTIEAKYVNTTSNIILSKNKEFIPIIVIPSNVKLILFTILLSFFGYYILDISGSEIKIKSLWKK